MGRPLKTLIRREIHFLQRILNGWSRLLLLAGVGCLIGAAFLPLWEIRLVAPQYQEGLTMTIYAHKLEGGNKGQDLFEINNLNHYIGMQPIRESDFVEMKWIPFALGFFVLITLRAAVLGHMRHTVDLTVLFIYFSLFSLGNFYYRLYSYGHDLDPTAPMTIEPFTPTMIGVNKIANFTQYSYPQAGGIFLFLFPVLCVAAMWLSRKEPTPSET